VCARVHALCGVCACVYSSGGRWLNEVWLIY